MSCSDRNSRTIQLGKGNCQLMLNMNAFSKPSTTFLKPRQMQTNSFFGSARSLHPKQILFFVLISFEVTRFSIWGNFIYLLQSPLALGHPGSHTLLCSAEMGSDHVCAFPCVYYTGFFSLRLQRNTGVVLAYIDFYEGGYNSTV